MERLCDEMPLKMPSSRSLIKIPILEKEGGKMTKAEIVDQIASKTGFAKRESAEMVELIFDLMKSTLESGKELKISGFGKFEVKQKADRRGRNPQTGEEITIQARKILTFKASAMLKDSINGNNGAA